MIHVEILTALAIRNNRVEVGKTTADQTKEIILGVSRLVRLRQKRHKHRTAFTSRPGIANDSRPRRRQTHLQAELAIV